ncbi:uncharacterized protein KY384_003340 [Bacidia gigantensis]|uniref:uncharacterized protein n=1 Tax=Bacidia gigantensis TaxID=2732470 RepID=UPI001D05C14A|nr:uncharacterized protein KY384_003340 [Bacidia gigantensis]KAG8531708.1 hypothetical protein KY384_003340 [Bacidia gigantensis]
MSLLSLLLVLAYQTTSTLAHPAPQSQPQQDAGTSASLVARGIPSQGVVCETNNEPAHILSIETIASRIELGIAGYEESLLGIPSQGGGSPAHFHPSAQLGSDANEDIYTVIPAAGCDLSQDLLFLPIAYPGANAANNTVPEPTAPMGKLSTDIVVFVVPQANGTKTERGGWTTDYCAVLTNSDVGDEGKLLWVDGKINLDASGYHQCNDNNQPDGQVQVPSTGSGVGTGTSTGGTGLPGADTGEGTVVGAGRGGNP